MQENLVESQSRESLQQAIETLPVDDQLMIVESIIHKLWTKQRPQPTGQKLSDLYGMGKGLWSEDAQEYVNKLREERQ